ncbi:MAG: formamidopyrimidine-DNA glycosylase [Acidobacteriota bacterium]|nr:formamidopyrimidine-DNA glycosylase [Acidobacteriota bacterium]
MPELPDIVVYIEALEQRILDQTLERVRISAPFLLRTAVPPITSVEGRKVLELRRLGKRICIGLEENLWLVLHLMIAGRLHWRDADVARGDRATEGAIKRSKRDLAAFDFNNGTLSLTEAGTQRRASLHLVQGEDSLQGFDPGGLEIFEIDVDRFAKVLQSANHTLKRALTDPRLFSGIGNAYSDEILFHARLSPIALTQKLTSEQIERLFNSTRTTLMKWIELLRAQLVTQTVSLRARGSSPTVREGAKQVRAGSGPRKAAARLGGDQVLASSNAQRPKSNVQDRVSQGEEGRHAPAPAGTIGSFPEKVTAFRPEMAVHGKYHQPCPRCGEKIQRIRYASNETNYCPGCQTNGKLLADRALSRLLRADWPRTAEELEGLVRDK